MFNFYNQSEEEKKLYKVFSYHDEEERLIVTKTLAR